MKANFWSLVFAGMAFLLTSVTVQAREVVPPAADDPAVQEISRFVDLYAKGDIDKLVEGMFTGYEDLMGASTISLKTQLKQARDYYGAVVDYEATEVEIISKRLRLYTFLVHQEKLPIFWNVYVYDIDGKWRIIEFTFNDLAAARKKP